MIPQNTTENVSSIYHKETKALSQTEQQESDSIRQNDSSYNQNENLLFFTHTTYPNTEYVSTDYDSIMRHRELNNIETSDMYVLGAEMPDRDVTSCTREYSLGNDDWITVSIFLMFALISVIIYNSGTFLAYRIKDFFSHKRKYTDENGRASTSEARYTLILSSISSMSTCLILCNRIIDKEAQSIDHTYIYKILSIGFLAFMGFIFIKALMYILINWIFFNGTEGRKWISSYFLITSVSAFILFPLALIEIYSEYELPQIKFCLPLVFILYEVLLFYKLCTNFRTKKHGIPLIFLYFCSVEIMPSFVLWHIFNGVNESFIVKI